MGNQFTDKWTEKELKILKDVTLTNTEVAELIERSYSAIKRKRSDLKIEAKKNIDYWTLDEITVLVKNKNKSNLEISKILKRSIRSIQFKRTKLNLTAMSDKWDEDEIEYLIENYFLKEKKEISNFLGRTISSVFTKANEIGLSKKNDYWTKNELEILRDNFDCEISNLNILIPSKTKTQIIYKKSLVKKIDGIRQEENISNKENFFKSTKENRMFNLLGVLEVGESFEIESKDYIDFLTARILIKNKIFKSKKVTAKTRRVFRIN